MGLFVTHGFVCVCVHECVRVCICVRVRIVYMCACVWCIALCVLCACGCCVHVYTCVCVCVHVCVHYFPYVSPVNRMRTAGHSVWRLSPVTDAWPRAAVSVEVLSTCRLARSPEGSGSAVGVCFFVQHLLRLWGGWQTPAAPTPQTPLAPHSGKPRGCRPCLGAGGVPPRVPLSPI